MQLSLNVLCLLLFYLKPCTRAQTEGTIRLLREGVASQAYASGRVQVRLDSQWGNVCGDKTTSPFTLDEGDVACRQLGYTGSSGVTIATEDSYDIDSSPTLVDQFDCLASDFNMVLFQCTFSTIINPINCDDNDDVGISCYTSRLWFDPFPGMVRLQNGSYSSEGIVEVFCNGIWTNLCGDSITSDDSNTVCLQLGYKGVENITTSVSTAVNNTQWFESLSCEKPESCTSSCQSCPDTLSPPPHSCITAAFISCHYADPLVKSYQNATPSTIYSCTSGYYPRGAGAVRLSRGDLYSIDYSSGRVQVYYNGVWGNVCRLGGFNSMAADVICHQAGWTGASGWSYAAIDNFPTDVRVTHYSNISCTNSQYLVIQQCSYSTAVDTTKCTDNDDVSVTCYDAHIWDNPFRGMIRLVGPNFINEGRVEVYCNGAWGTICNREFDSVDRMIICQQLGYNKVFEVSDLSLSSVNSSSPVWLDSLVCLNSDTYKCISNCQDCPTYPSTIADCVGHDNDISVQCYIEPEEKPVAEDFSDCQITDTSIGVSSEGSIVLHQQGLDSSTLSSGIVALYHRGEWGNICHRSSFTITEADVICHQMMYTGASSFTSGTSNHEFGVDSRPAVLTDILCSSGNELTALQCSFEDDSSTLLNCGDENDLAVTCYNAKLWDNPYPGMVRLMGGDFTNEGRVEVYCSGSWGTVCDTDFETNDANAICRQLGYTEASLITTRPAADDRPIWLDSLQCEGKPYKPSCISSCQRCPVTGDSSSKCTHSNDATIQCFHDSTGDTSVQSSGLNGACALDSQLPNTAQSGAMIFDQNGNSSRSYTLGRVLVNYNGRWGTICRRESFGNTEADVICHQLAFSGASIWRFAAEDKFTSNPLPVIFKDVSCSDPNYMTIFQCSVSTITTGCTVDDAVSVACYSSPIWNNPFDTSVRLSSGNYANEGLLEVYCNSNWGTVCNQTFTSTVGTTVCRQLGYHSYNSDYSLQISGTTDQNIWLDQLSCSAISNCLYNCQKCPGSTSSQCTHVQDVSIQCTVSQTLEAESNVNVIKTCLVRSNYFIYIIAGSCGGVIILGIAIITIICCIRVQNKKGNCPKPCGKWEVEIDETNAGPLSLAMKQRNRKAPITVPVVSEDDPPPYDLTNAPPLSTDPDKPPEYDPEEFGQQSPTV